MSLSSQWSQSVVVRSEGTRGEVVVVQPSPSQSSARAYAAAGNPIIIRPRDPRIFTAPSSRANGQQAPSASTTALVLSAFTGRDLAETFWVPDPSRQEMGLLETLARRGRGNTTNLLLQSRPLAELQCNFSTCTNHNIDLSHNAFRLSKTAMALHHMNRTLDDDEDEVPGEGGDWDRPTHTGASSGGQSHAGCGSSTSRFSMSTRSFKATVRASLRTLQEEDFYLVKYRDYSAWAVREYRSICRSDTLFGSKYVEQCFAVHVGREPGELILISEAQFLYGFDVLQRQLLNRLEALPVRSSLNVANANESTYRQYMIDINYSSLNSDQFASLSAMLGDGMRRVMVEAEEVKREEEARKQRENPPLGHAATAPYDAPAWYDWTPGAVRRRVNHQLTLYYTSVGRLTVQALVLGICGYYVYRTIKDFMPGSGAGSLDDGPRGNSRSSRRGNRGDGMRGGRDSREYRQWEDGEGNYYVRRGLLRSMLMGPKEVMDYILAPTD